MPAKTVFVTGAGAGIGRATCEVLAAKGCTLALIDIDKAAIDSLAAELSTDAIAFEGSVPNFAQVEEAMKATARQFGQIDAVFANAGVASLNPVAIMDEREWLHIIEINLNGVWRTLKAATPHLLASKGYVLVASSVASSIALPLASPYTATKAAVLNLAEAYRSEMRGFGIEVGTIHPTFITTPMVQKAIHEDELGKLIASTSKILFMEFPAVWAGKTAASMILHRRRRATVPEITHLPFIWFPRFAHGFANIWAFRRGRMREIVEQARARRTR